jgi:hypothetical protein
MKNSFGSIDSTVFNGSVASGSKRELLKSGFTNSKTEWVIHTCIH